MSNAFSRRGQKSSGSQTQPRLTSSIRRLPPPPRIGQGSYQSLGSRKHDYKGKPITVSDPSSDREVTPEKQSRSSNEEDDLENISQEEFDLKSPVKKQKKPSMFSKAAKFGKYKTAPDLGPHKANLLSDVRPTFSKIIKRVSNPNPGRIDPAFDASRGENYNKSKEKSNNKKSKNDNSSAKDIDLLDNLTEEEKKLMGGSNKTLKLATKAPPSSVPDSFLTAKIKNSDKEEPVKEPEVEFTEEESKLTGESKISKLLANTKAKNDDFLETLQKSKITKRDTPELEDKNKSYINIDIDESFDTGLVNNFEEFNEAKNFKKQRKIIESKYENKSFPIVWDEDDFIAKATPHLSCVPKILSGKLDSPYYAEASDIAKESPSTHLSSSEFLRLPISHFTIGFYGVKRQAIIASIIKQHYQKDLEKAQLINKTMKFWSLDSFVLYVLSCEVAVRMAAKDLKISAGEALDILEETVDYGKYITDPVPVAPSTKPTNSQGNRNDVEEILSESEKEDEIEDDSELDIL
ncbi:hypothetical protein BN7_1708 [Wickerhamomyces ciferrii]|uniref:Restriction of telomere capping protein 4 n=1 Tax=Wickerhamomyces ciferrii (strain ATCC 14091 / BCRC 22168 / CBS 111 / JCM 3599 / NBRC 0793 / NRRL Y-1031 F-60-10) TaxID=1206466 RepID=K0KL80_WICCF|nr:uncharacterized protein BN7_1708 [Wickerhamomyces ciferrii]CCH42164.1 hypothetical protein BN7_1708 [Wickerhamomyces ciferrii]